MDVLAEYGSDHSQSDEEHPVPACSSDSGLCASSSRRSSKEQTAADPRVLPPFIRRSSLSSTSLFDVLPPPSKRFKREVTPPTSSSSPTSSTSSGELKVVRFDNPPEPKTPISHPPSINVPHCLPLAPTASIPRAAAVSSKFKSKNQITSLAHEYQRAQIEKKQFEMHSTLHKRG
eukprot:ANDGO_08010.mRNA.1 hypothetical protein